MADTGVQPDGDVVPDQFDEGVYIDSGDSNDSETAEAVDIKELCSEGKDCAELCEGGQILCITGECHQCCADDDCEPVAGSVVVCTNGGVCEIVPPCGGLCGAELPYCAMVSGVEQCVQCQTDDDCTGISSACSCKETAGWSCLMQHGTACQEGVLQCVYPADLPASWGPVGAASYLQIPSNSEEKLGCFDYTGDGLGDSGISALAVQLNPSLNRIITEGNIAILMEFKGLSNLTADTKFVLYGTTGTPIHPGFLVDGVYLDTEDHLFNMDTCEAAVKFDAEINNGALSGRADKISIKVYVAPTLTIVLNLIDVRIFAGLDAIGVGVDASDGVLSAILTKEEFDGALNAIGEACDGDPQSPELVEICPYVEVSHTTGYSSFDLSRLTDGTYVSHDAEHSRNAMSVCMKFILVPANVVGYRPIS